jgi:hypothetical protein
LGLRLKIIFLNCLEFRKKESHLQLKMFFNPKKENFNPKKLESFLKQFKRSSINCIKKGKSPETENIR